MLRKLLSHAAIYGLAAQVPRLAGVFTLPIITQHLTTTDYGVAGVVTAYIVALNMLQSLGLSVVMVNSFARHPIRYKWIWRQLNGFLTCWSLMYGVLVGVVLYWVVPPEAQEYRFQIALLNCLPTMLFMGTEIQANLYYQLSQQPFPVALRSFLVGVTGVGLNIFLIAYLKLGYIGWFYAGFFSSTIGFIINGYSIYLRQQLWPIMRFKWSRIRSSLRVSLPMVPHNLSYYLLDASDRLVLDALQVPLRHIGLYNVASSFGGYFMVASGAIVQAASPFYMRFYAQKSDLASALEARRLTYGLQISFLLATFFGSLWMREVFQILIKNQDLQQAYPLAIVILMGYNFRPMYLAVTNLLIYREHTRKLWKISAVAGLGNVLLNFILVPVYGFEVAAITTFVAMMYLGYAGFCLKEYKQSAMVSYQPLLWFVLTVLALAVVYNLANLDIILKAYITISITLITMGAVVLFRRHLFLKQ